jgi:D-sedoheptulose 7-phosphate isomerase
MQEFPDFPRWLEASRAALAGLAALEAPLEAAVGLAAAALRQGRPLLVCGNGGSAADAQHITAELVGRFLRDRRGLPVICLADNAAVLTAWANDVGYDDVFARQVEAYGGRGGVLLALSTSGNSRNVVLAAERALALGLGVIGLTGAGGGALGPLCAPLLAVAETSTPLVQQAHLVLYHWFCGRLEASLAA